MTLLRGSTPYKISKIGVFGNFIISQKLNFFFLNDQELLHISYSFGSLMWNTSLPILFSHTHIEYFMSVFQHGYWCQLILYSPVEDFVRILLSHTLIEYFTSLFHHDYGCKLILYSPVEDFVCILLLHTRIEYFMCVFQHDYWCQLILQAPVEDFVCILLSHTPIEYLICLFEHGYLCSLILQVLEVLYGIFGVHMCLVHMLSPKHG